MTLPDPQLPLNPGHVFDDPPEDEVQTAATPEGEASGDSHAHEDPESET